MSQYAAILCSTVCSSEAQPIHSPHSHDSEQDFVYDNHLYRMLNKLSHESWQWNGYE
jgi:hypothetical protein